MSKKLSMVWSAVLLAGAILLGIGLWFLLCKAGLPYQDPTPEMTIRYEAYRMSGETVSLWGGGSLAAGAVGRLLCRHKR